MFDKCKEIIFLIFTPVFLYANNFELTNHGILSYLNNEIISRGIKIADSTSYDLYFSYNNIFGDVLVFESNSQYRHICYVPIYNKKDSFFVRNAFCLNKYINFDSEVWQGSSYSTGDNIKLSEVSSDDIINLGKTGRFKLTSNSMGEVKRDKISFKGFMYKIGEVDYIFKLYNGEPDLRYGALEICYKIIKNKVYLYNKPYYKEKTNMYLIKNDKVCFLDKKSINKEDWYFINYKGKKDINMWIKADSVDLN